MKEYFHTSADYLSMRHGGITHAFNVIQTNIGSWILKAFGSRDYLTNKEERAARFMEEALEVAQAAGLSDIKAHNLVSQVYGKPVGEIKQEIGGAMHCLLALSEAYEINAGQCIIETAEDVWEPERMARIVANHQKKVRATEFGG